MLSYQLHVGVLRYSYSLRTDKYLKGMKQKIDIATFAMR
ncbi:Uncharacterised protein [Bifidobacterium dentium]|uniref:Uncharacterized protein n=1 Tax=Bifidobacterium dentium TaxID=1689 RepID=A0A6N2RGJ9_9BIFI|nr:hypothetical protein HMPREF1494_0297 [Bifidobacterium sp. MSTE12]